LKEYEENEKGELVLTCEHEWSKWKGPNYYRHPDKDNMVAVRRCAICGLEEYMLPLID
jgi:hypothetical protein